MFRWIDTIFPRRALFQRDRRLLHLFLGRVLASVGFSIVIPFLSLYLHGTRGVPMSMVGGVFFIAALAGAVGQIVGGELSDRRGRKFVLICSQLIRAVAFFGLGFAVMTRAPFAVFALLTSVSAFAGRMFEPPSGAMVADIAPPQLRGAAFGLRQSLDTVGAFFGPLLAVGLMLLWANDFRAVFWVAVLPGLMAVALLLFGIHEPERRQTSTGRNPFRWDNLTRLASAYWWVVGFGAIFALARFSEAFLVLRAQHGGIPVALVPLVMVAMNLIYALSAYPFGKLSDQMSHMKLLALGLLVLIAADLVLAMNDRWGAVLLGVGLWGLHMGMTQGLLATMVADTAPADLRGTAYGFFNLTSGLAMLIASVLAGFLWDQFGASFTFYAGAVFCGIAVMGLTLYQLKIDE